MVIVTPKEEPVTVIRASSTAGSQIQRVVMAPVNSVSEAPFSRRAMVDSAMEEEEVLTPPPPYPSSPPDSPGQSSLANAPNVEEIPAREPDPNAKPTKPALRHTGTAGAFARLKRERRRSNSSSPPPSDSSDSDEVNFRSEEAEALADRMEGQASLHSNGHTSSGEEEEEDDDDTPKSGLAAKVSRKDTLALRNLLGEDSSDTQLPDDEQEPESPKEKMRQASIKLER